MDEEAAHDSREEQNDSLRGRNHRMSQQGGESIRSLQKCNSLGESFLPHQSMAYVMSIESDRKSDIYERIICLEDLQKSTHLRRSDKQPSSSRKIQQQTNRKSGVDDKNVFHACKCQDTCQGIHCPCYLKTDQICIRGICCDNCVKYKLSILNKSKGCSCKNSKCLKLSCKCFVSDVPCNSQCGCQHCENNQTRYDGKIKNKRRGKTNTQQKPVVKSPQLISILANSDGKVENLKGGVADTCCSCRKTRCVKKYCSCYFNGAKCGKYCTCQSCQNVGAEYNKERNFNNENELQEFNQDKARYARHNDQEMSDEEEGQSKKQPCDDIQQYFDDNPGDNIAMPRQMHFDPVNFQQMFDRMKM